jgi:hypothetical protein
MKKERKREAQRALPRRDQRGRPLSIGDLVRVVGVPELRGEILVRESLPVMRDVVDGVDLRVME